MLLVLSMMGAAATQRNGDAKREISPWLVYSGHEFTWIIFQKEN